MKAGNKYGTQDKNRAAYMPCDGGGVHGDGGGQDAAPRKKSEVIPETVYAQYGERAENAEFFLRSSGGYVAVYTGQKEKEPVTVTAIEVSNLRGADRAMLEKGIPVSDKSELLELLEDLGS